MFYFILGVVCALAFVAFGYHYRGWVEKEKAAVAQEARNLASKL